MAALIAGLMLWLLSPVAQAYALRFDPATQNVLLGSTASVVVRVEGVQPGGLGAYDFEVAFDPAVLTFSHAVDAFGLGIAIGLSATPGPDKVVLSDFSFELPVDLVALQPDNFDLLTLVFDTVAPGTSALTMSGIALGDAEGNVVDGEAQTGSITVKPRQIPEPGSSALAALAVALGLVVGRRSSGSASAASC